MSQWSLVGRWGTTNQSFLPFQIRIIRTPPCHFSACSIYNANITMQYWHFWHGWRTFGTFKTGRSRRFIRCSRELLCSIFITDNYPMTWQTSLHYCSQWASTLLWLPTGSVGEALAKEREDCFSFILITLILRCYFALQNWKRQVVVCHLDQIFFF
jgi:hypothetical protein